MNQGIKVIFHAAIILLCFVVVYLQQSGYWEKESIMGIFSRLIEQPMEPRISTSAVQGVPGNMTAHQAWAVVAPEVRSLDPDAKLTLITSGLDINSQGCSRTWEFIFIMPNRKATIMMSLGPDPYAADIDHSAPLLTQRINQATPIKAQQPIFPVSFQNSPEVVAEFSSQGVDFVAGPSDMKLEGRLLPSGEAVWVTFYRDQEFTTSF